MTVADLPLTVDPSRLSTAELLAVAGELEPFLASLSDQDVLMLRYEWSFWGRPAQHEPVGGWRVWLVRAGRGFGKTRTGAEVLRRRVQAGEVRRAGLIAPTAADARDVMVEGESGVLATSPPWFRPKYEPSKRRLTWPNGAVGTLYSAEEPERLRGPQHDWLWGDEPASWARGQETFDNASLGLRLGANPQMMLTGTPKPTPWLRAVSLEPSTETTTGSTYDNISNLADPFIDLVVGRYEGTRLGRQELHGEWLDDVEGALWTDLLIDLARLTLWDRNDPWRDVNLWAEATGRPVRIDRRPWRVVVAVDPPGETAECGIVVGAAPVQGGAGVDPAVVLEDSSTAGRPEAWGAAVVQAARRWQASEIVVESNQGGDMVRATIHSVDPSVKVTKVAAQESKKARAEPVSALYERGWVHHVGFMPGLEGQMTSWVPGEGKSPDRMDALVHLIRHLLPAKRGGRVKMGVPI